MLAVAVQLLGIVVLAALTGQDSIGNTRTLQKSTNLSPVRPIADCASPAMARKSNAAFLHLQAGKLVTAAKDCKDREVQDRLIEMAINCLEEAEGERYLTNDPPLGKPN